MPGYPCCCVAPTPGGIDCEDATDTYPTLTATIAGVDLAPCRRFWPFPDESVRFDESGLTINGSFVLTQCETNPCVYVFDGTLGDLIESNWRQDLPDSSQCLGTPAATFNHKYFVRVTFTESATVGRFNVYGQSFVSIPAPFLPPAYSVFFGFGILTGDSFVSLDLSVNGAQYWQQSFPPPTVSELTTNECLVGMGAISWVWDIGANGTMTITPP